MVGGGNPFYLKFWVNRPRWSEIANFEPIFDFAPSVSAVTPSSINSNKKTTLRAFQWTYVLTAPVVFFLKQQFIEESLLQSFLV